MLRPEDSARHTIDQKQATVNRNFQNWVFKKQAETLKFTEEQMEWLRMIKDHVANSFYVNREHFDYSPFVQKGGLGRIWR